MGDKAPPWAPPPLISFKSGSSSGRRFRSFGNRSSPAKGKESPEKQGEHQAAPISDPEKDQEQTHKQEGPDATPKMPEQSPQLSIQMAVDAPAPAQPVAEEGELPLSSEANHLSTSAPPVSDHVDVEKGELPGDEAEMNMQVEKAGDEELEEGELPSSEAADVMERNKEIPGTPEHARASPILGLLDPAKPEADEPLEFTLADWHLHVTTGKPLPRKEPPKLTENPTETQAKKKKKRKRKKGSKKEPESKKQKAQSYTPSDTIFLPATRVLPGSPLLAKRVLEAAPTPVPRPVEVKVKQEAAPVTEVKPEEAPKQEKVKPEEPLVNEPQEPKPPAASPKKGEEKKEQEMTLTMMIEKELGIWVDPVEEKQKKKRVLTAERRKKKKANERIKRAEKDRAMGIARRRPLVFKPIERPPLVCKYFLKGRCSKGESCTFSHEAVPETKQYLCKYFLTRCCLKGDDFPFSHEPSKFPCKFLVTRGFCKDGDQCRFSHKPISNEERDKLLKRVLAEQKEHEAKVYEERIAPGDDDDEEDDDDDDDGDEEEYEPDYNPDFPVKQNSDMDYDPAPDSCWWKPGSGEAGEYDPSPGVPQVDAVKSYSTADDEEAPSSWWMNRAAENEKRFEATKPSSCGSNTGKDKIMDLLQRELNESGGVF